MRHLAKRPGNRGKRGFAPVNAIEAIREVNRGRNPDLLALKWAKMRAGPFAFYRGTARLFFQEWSKQKVPAAPAVWVCGDAHPENVGSYRGDDGIPYFDINDFDEACLAPAHCDLGRALGALFILRKAKHARAFLEAYRQTLLRGKPKHIEPETAHGPIAALLRQVAERSRKDFLAAWVKRGKLRIRPGHSCSLDKAARSRARAVFEAWARKQPDPKVYRLIDICGRIAGNGSLGLERYVLLTSGKKLPLIMDMKEANPSAVLACFKAAQPDWRCEAERVAKVQYFLQYVPIACLSWTGAKKKSFIIRELQPVEDRIDIGKLTGSDYDKFVVSWARLLASGHIRSGGWRGGATIETLMRYGRGLNGAAQGRLLGAASRVARLQVKAYGAFRKWGPG